MRKLYYYLKSLSNYQQTLFVQFLLYVTTALGLLFVFDLKLFLLGLALGWLLFCFGVSISLHKWISHRTFTPKNRLIKLFLLWAATQSTLGSPIGFAAGHRQHHRDSDGPTDPFALSNSVWHNVKLWFYHFSTEHIGARLVKDLASDRDFKFFHKHYWRIWIVVPLVLTVINPLYFIYFVAVPAVYVFLGMSYVTVIAHSLSWKRMFKGTNPYNDLDDSWDSRFFTVLFAGEGYHHTHHVHPGQYNYKDINGRTDPSGWIIKYLRYESAERTEHSRAHDQLV